MLVMFFPVWGEHLKRTALKFQPHCWTQVSQWVWWNVHIPVCLQTVSKLSPNCHNWIRKTLASPERPGCWGLFGNAVCSLLPRVTAQRRTVNKNTHCHIQKKKLAVICSPPTFTPPLFFFERGSWSFISVGGLWLCFNERMTAVGR